MKTRIYLTRIDNIIQDITYLAEEIRTEQGGRNKITTRLRSCASDLDAVADLIANTPEDDDDDDDFVPLSSVPKRVVRESDDEETEWFDSNGDIKRHFPKDCILDCSRSGSVDDEVDYWVSELNFKVPVDRGLSYVREYGLDDIGPEDVDKYVLWIMCGNIKEEAYEFCRDGSEWEYVDRESYPDEMDNWNDEDWDRFQEEACVCHLGM